MQCATSLATSPGSPNSGLLAHGAFIGLLTDVVQRSHQRVHLGPKRTAKSLVLDGSAEDELVRGWANAAWNVVAKAEIVWPHHSSAAASFGDSISNLMIDFFAARQGELHLHGGGELKYKALSATRPFFLQAEELVTDLFRELSMGRLRGYCPDKANHLQPIEHLTAGARNEGTMRFAIIGDRRSISGRNEF